MYPPTDPIFQIGGPKLQKASFAFIAADTSMCGAHLYTRLSPRGSPATVLFVHSYAWLALDSHPISNRSSNNVPQILPPTLFLQNAIPKHFCYVRYNVLTKG